MPGGLRSWTKSEELPVKFGTSPNEKNNPHPSTIIQPILRNRLNLLSSPLSLLLQRSRSVNRLLQGLGGSERRWFQ
jgi:hypothetical protein